jgi:hypothetical protein
VIGFRIDNHTIKRGPLNLKWLSSATRCVNIAYSLSLVTWQEYEKHTLKNILKMLTHMHKLVNTWEVSTFEKVKERTCWVAERVMVVGPSSQVVGPLGTKGAWCGLR